jgi:hypothetical protein
MCFSFSIGTPWVDYACNYERSYKLTQLALFTTDLHAVIVTVGFCLRNTGVENFYKIYFANNFIKISVQFDPKKS